MCDPTNKRLHDYIVNLVVRFTFLFFYDYSSFNCFVGLLVRSPYSKCVSARALVILSRSHRTFACSRAQVAWSQLADTTENGRVSSSFSCVAQWKNQHARNTDEEKKKRDKVEFSQMNMNFFPGYSIDRRRSNVDDDKAYGIDK